MYIEDKLYSVTLTEDELRLYSEFLEQREYGFFGAMVQKGRAAIAGIGKKGLSKVASASDGVLHDQLTGKILDKAVKQESRQIAANAAADVEKIGGLRQVVKVKQGAQAAGNAVADGAKAAGTAIADTGKAAVEGTRNAVREARQAMNQTGSEVKGWFGRQAKKVKSGYTDAVEGVQGRVKQAKRDFAANRIKNARSTIQRYAY